MYIFLKNDYKQQILSCNRTSEPQNDQSEFGNEGFLVFLVTGDVLKEHFIK